MVSGRALTDSAGGTWDSNPVYLARSVSAELDVEILGLCKDEYVALGGRNRSSYGKGSTLSGRSRTVLVSGSGYTTSIRCARHVRNALLAFA